MHYPSYAFSRDGGRTIVTKDIKYIFKERALSTNHRRHSFCTETNRRSVKEAASVSAIWKKLTSGTDVQSTSPTILRAQNPHQ